MSCFYVKYNHFGKKIIISTKHPGWSALKSFLNCDGFIAEDMYRFIKNDDIWDAPKVSKISFCCWDYFDSNTINDKKYSRNLTFKN